MKSSSCELLFRIAYFSRSGKSPSQIDPLVVFGRLPVRQPRQQRKRRQPHGQHRQLPHLTGRIGRIQIRPDDREMGQRFNERHEHRHRDDREQKRPPGADGRLIKHGQEHDVEHAVDQQHGAEERDICIDAGEIRAVGVDARGEERERDRDHELRQLHRHDEAGAGAHLVALRDRQHSAVIDVLILAAVEEREENAKQTVEKHDRVRIVRDDEHDAEERKHVHHRVRREAQILRENLRCHSFSFPRALECPRATSARRRTARDSARGNRRACRCTGSARL